MSGIPDFNASLPKTFKSASMKDIPDLDIKSYYIPISQLLATDKMIRLNAEYVSILKANSKRDLVMVVKDFNIRGVDERSIVYYYNKATERNGQMLFVDSVKGQLRYNFDKPIDIDQ
ncbi:unnamed protein product [Phytophthora lilii]|uniref:Unnamed protein product n=1 Tax=Phytophthora lilii TaxID=2077276 RepID=A0A9W6TNA7_9STRA|nr:unnamed protein product [Phytophthora lilii]